MNGKTLTIQGWHGKLCTPVPMPMTIRHYFRAVFDQYQELDGKPFTVDRILDTPSPTLDIENLPMFLITIDGQQIHAWPEEVAEDA
jgi:hypothetical protein